ncbi:hypothetical protein OK016_10610 [Vibrio chagasii]|nr:hypothetical protein [Vibrio chagasii]
MGKEDVQKQLNKKSLIIGVMETEPDGSTAADQFVIALSQAKQIVDGVELVYRSWRERRDKKIDDIPKADAAF